MLNKHRVVAQVIHLDIVILTLDPRALCARLHWFICGYADHCAESQRRIQGCSSTSLSRVLPLSHARMSKRKPGNVEAWWLTNVPWSWLDGAAAASVAKPEHPIRGLLINKVVCHTRPCFCQSLRHFPCGLLRTRLCMLARPDPSITPMRGKSYRIHVSCKLYWRIYCPQCSPVHRSPKFASCVRYTRPTTGLWYDRSQVEEPFRRVITASTYKHFDSCGYSCRDGRRGEMSMHP